MHEPAAPDPVVLCVDDDEHVLRAVVRGLSGLPVRVHPASSALSALQWLHAGGRPAVVITDFRMPPGPTGLVLLKAVAQLAPDARCALYTAERELGPVADSIAVFAKPTAPEDLRRFVREALEGRSSPPRGGTVE
ncbi:MAG: response regulator [Deltaproteobacteria bacterium]|nr:response regulator [Deltaproteobacteria bacterium]